MLPSSGKDSTVLKKELIIFRWSQMCQLPRGVHWLAALDSACWWPAETFTLRCACAVTQSWTAWEGILQWHGGFPNVYPSNIVPIGSMFLWLFVLDQLSAAPASLSLAQLDTSLLRFARLCMRKKKHMSWIPWWEVGILIFLFPGLFRITVSLYFLCLQNLTRYWTGFSKGLLNMHAL